MSTGGVACHTCARRSLHRRSAVAAVGSVQALPPRPAPTRAVGAHGGRCLVASTWTAARTEPGGPARPVRWLTEVFSHFFPTASGGDHPPRRGTERPRTQIFRYISGVAEIRSCRGCGRWLEPPKGRGRPRKSCDDKCEAVYQQALRDHKALPGDSIVRHQDAASIQLLLNQLHEVLAAPSFDGEETRVRAYALARAVGTHLFGSEVAERGVDLRLIEGSHG